MLKYQINLVRTLREDEKRNEERRSYVLLFSAISFGILALSIIYAGFELLSMNSILKMEKDKLARIEAEYSKYKSTRMIVDKRDLELLDSLQNNRVFWTKKLAAMALHLPDNYWITQFSYAPPLYKAFGYGYISQKQEQLITIDDYLNNLRVDSTYCDVFHATFFNSTTRTDEGNRMRVSFEYSSNR